LRGHKDEGISFKNYFKSIMGPFFKGKKVLLSLTKRLSNNFNLSIAEVDDQDIHQSIVIGIAVIGVSMKILEAMKEKILDFIEENTDAEIINIQEEIESF